MILHEIRRPNSLKIVPSGVANCRNLPFGGRATRGLTGASSKGGRCAESPLTFIWGKRRKNQNVCGLWNLSVKGSGVVFTYEEGISTPRVTRDGSLQSSVQIWLQNYVFFPVLCFFAFYGSFCNFFYFLWSIRVFLSFLYILNCDEEIRPT